MLRGKSGKDLMRSKGGCAGVQARQAFNFLFYQSAGHMRQHAPEEFSMSCLIFNFQLHSTTWSRTLNVSASASLCWEHRATFGVQLLTPLKSPLVSRHSPWRNTTPVCMIMISVCLFLLQQALSFCCSDIPYAPYRNISRVQTVL